MLIKGLNFSYNGHEVFRNFSFQSDANLILFMGPSGCGKTTLLKIISNNLTQNLNYQILQTSSKPFLILQEDALSPWLSGIDNITRFLNISKNVLEDYGLFTHTKSFIDKKACYMSYGQRRLIELLRSICFQPDLLLLDEPFNYLDYKSRTIVSETLRKLINRHKTRIVFTSHYNEDIGELAPEIHLFGFKNPISALSNEKVN